MEGNAAMFQGGLCTCHASGIFLFVLGRDIPQKIENEPSNLPEEWPYIGPPVTLVFDIVH
jgi:hypothetical protein